MTNNGCKVDGMRQVTPLQLSTGPDLVHKYSAPQDQDGMASGRRTDRMAEEFSPRLMVGASGASEVAHYRKL